MDFPDSDALTLAAQRRLNAWARLGAKGALVAGALVVVTATACETTTPATLYGPPPDDRPKSLEEERTPNSVSPTNAPGDKDTTGASATTTDGSSGEAAPPQPGAGTEDKPK